jgi:hypothetical protein
MPVFTQPRTWRTLQRHPESAKYPDLTGKALERMRNGVRDHGNITGRKIKLAPDEEDGGKIKVVDGWQLYLACIEFDVKPTFEPLRLPKGMTLPEWVELVNDARRHESEETISRRIEDRRERVAKARTEGQSIRAIAGAEGVSTTTVLKDLNTQGVNGVTPCPEDGKVTGTDGSKHPANKPERILCDGCKRKGVRKDCPACADLNRKGPPKKRGPAKSEGNGEAEGSTDDFGTLLPKSVRDAFLDPWIQKTFDFLCVTSEQFRKQRIPDGMKKRAKHYPTFNEKDVIDGCGFVIDYLDKLVEHFKTQRPAGVCPVCKGEKCADCRNTGLVSRELYKELKAKTRAAK